MKRPNLYDYLKILAIVTMIIDHVWFLFYPDLLILRIIGRMAFPLFLFLVWYNHSYGWKSSLWVYGAVLQILMRVWSAYWLIDMWYANILLAIWWTRVIMKILQQYDSLVGEIIVYIIGMWLLRYTYEYIDYWTLSVVFALVGYWARKYGNTVYTSLIIAISVWYHLLFMMYTTSFGQQSILLVLVWLILFACMFLMSKSNYTLQTSHKSVNHFLITISSYALEIYLIQILILGAIYMIF